MYVIIGCSITLLLYFTVMLFSISSPMVEASLVSTERPLDLGAAKQITVSVYPLRPPVKRPPVKCSSVKLYFFYYHKSCLIVIIYLHHSSIFSLTDSYCRVHEFLISRLILWSPQGRVVVTQEVMSLILTAQVMAAVAVSSMSRAHQSPCHCRSHFSSTRNDVR